MRNFIRKITPNWLLTWYRKRRKNQVRSQLEQQKNKGEIITLNQLIEQLKAAGFQSGDTVLVHSSLSKMGYIEGGPATVIQAFLEVIGPDGNLAMPNSPNASFQLDYIRHLDVFDVSKSASKLGAVTEVFRNWPGAIRSVNATEPVSAVGPKAQWLTEGHIGEPTPYTTNSPFYRITELKGKIAYIGVTLDNAGTSLHLLEDAVTDFPYPVYFPEWFSAKVKLNDGTIVEYQTRVHNPEQSKLRKCDELLPDFYASNCCFDATFGHAKMIVFDAQRMLHRMIEEFENYGVTMYTPKRKNN